MADTRTITMNGIEIYLDTRTTAQWGTVSRVIPKGFVCVELTTDGKCKMKCGDGVQLVTISRPTAFGEYAPYSFAENEEEFIIETKKM